MFNLMDAIRQKRKTQTLPPADSAETAETAQPRALELAENLRKPADFSAGTEFSATIRKDPQTPKTVKPAPTAGYGDLSANPQNPQTPENNSNQNPDALLMSLARTLEADAHRLRALLSDDDMQDIADGMNRPADMLAFFRLKQETGELLADQPRPTAWCKAASSTRTRENRPRHVERMKAWQPARDAMLNHLMICKRCHAPRNSYCPEGHQLRDDYHAAYEQSKELPSNP